jgi:ApaG protein
VHPRPHPEDIQVSVRPTYFFQGSDPARQRFVFTYHVRMENKGQDPARLLYRHWTIHDPEGEDIEVDGEGVVGEQPLLDPGGSHEYSSHCILRSPVGGFMEGYYTFVRGDGTLFRVPVPRFGLEAILPRMLDA